MEKRQQTYSDKVKKYMERKIIQVNIMCFVLYIIE